MEVAPRDGWHWVDLWHHEEASIVRRDGKSFVVGWLDAFDSRFLGSNNEGQAGCLVLLPKRITVFLRNNQLEIDGPGTLKIWAGDPSYEKASVKLGGGMQVVDVRERFGRYEGKIVIQAFEGKELVDETSVYIKSGAPRMISVVKRTTTSSQPPTGMVRIPGGKFTFNTTHGDEFIPYPHEQEETLEMASFYIDKFPVTNEQFRKFIASGYTPSDTSNFLKHWKNKKIPVGQEQFPAVYISLEDAQAYARWAGKRLPTEREWQYAAQTPARNEWPWKQTRPVIRKEQFVTETLTVKAIEGISPKNCNLGDGKPYPVGKYAAGANPFGLQDLTGCVWQLTNDVYESGSYRFIMMKGGSYFKPSSSWWYVQGGPRELHYRQYLLRVSEGFERNATVGFRCVADTTVK
jgi:formylglycine-generating enzyme required for sulfatase activity